MQAPNISQENSDDSSFLCKRIRLFSRIIIICWTFLIAIAWFWNYQAERKVFNKVALAEANAVIERDALYRRWVSSRGGVYVPITANTPPSSYLTHIAERDITTPSGKQLTLINPAYMARQVNELDKTGNLFSGRAHITSLKPLRPENSPDPWEAAALRSFESNAKEVSAVVMLEGKPFLRLMRPFITEEPCLKCHAKQGYTVGTVRGGISVSIPVQPMLDASYEQIAGSALFHTLIWLLGMGITVVGTRQLSRSASAQDIIGKELHQQTSQLEREIAEHQKAEEEIESKDAHLQIVADYAYNWEYWRLPDGTFQYMSPSVYELTGYTVQEFTTDPTLLLNVIHPEDRNLFKHHIHEIGTTGQILPIEMRIIHKCGEVLWLFHVCQQVYTPDGLPWGWRASNQDITARKMMETEMFQQAEELEEEVAERQAAQEQLEELNRSLEKRISLAVTDLRNKDQALIQQSRLAAMGEMINNIAHQWRQPLNNVGLIIQNLQFAYQAGTLSEEEMTSEVDKAMGVIIHMSRTIDDFRNFFRNDKQKSRFVVSMAVRNALEFVATALASQNIQVKFEDDESVTAIGYQNEYAQVLLNIISNVRETCIEHGATAAKMHIRVTCENERSVVYIEDNCGGIPADVMPKIFDPYFTTRAPDKGTGIGLYMSKVIIEQNMGGSLTARNTDCGAEFRIEV